MNILRYWLLLCFAARAVYACAISPLALCTSQNQTCAIQSVYTEKYLGISFDGQHLSVTQFSSVDNPATSFVFLKETVGNGQAIFSTYIPGAYLTVDSLSAGAPVIAKNYLLFTLQKERLVQQWYVQSIRDIGYALYVPTSHGKMYMNTQGHWDDLYINPLPFAFFHIRKFLFHLVPICIRAHTALHPE